MYLIENLEILYFVRFLNGYVGTLYTFICPLIAFEIIIPKFKKASTNLFYCFLTSGILFSYVFGNDWTVKHWKFVFLSPLILILPSFYFIIFYFPIKSPIYLYQLYINKEQQMEKNLFENYKIFYNNENALKMTKKFIKERKEIGLKTKNTIVFKDLLKKDYRLQFFIGFLLNFLNQATGINVLIYYSSKIFKDLKIKLSNVNFFIRFNKCSSINNNFYFQPTNKKKKTVYFRIFI